VWRLRNVVIGRGSMIRRCSRPSISKLLGCGLVNNFEGRE
jgi:hypothetical protein